ncbi:MAG: helix-turn-helix transcriptional regulator [Sinobacteraceae bacterium]|nr:helix-turn-helix transcriptional regulator [Nevskiaceae bacterium]
MACGRGRAPVAAAAPLCRRPASVSALAAACADSEPNVSRQLKQLATAGLVQRMRQGQYVEYALSTGEGSAAYMARWLLTQIDAGDAALQDARRALQQARDAEIARGVPGVGCCRRRASDARSRRRLQHLQARPLRCRSHCASVTRIADCIGCQGR